MAEKFAKVFSYCSWLEYFIFLALCLYVGVEQLWWDEPGPRVTEPAECVHSFHPRPLMAFIPCTSWKKNVHQNKSLSPTTELSNLFNALCKVFFFFFVMQQYANLLLNWATTPILNEWDDFPQVPKLNPGIDYGQGQEIFSIRRKSKIKAKEWDINSLFNRGERLFSLSSLLVFFGVNNAHRSHGGIFTINTIIYNN